MSINPAPIRSQIYRAGAMANEWVQWFQRVWKAVSDPRWIVGYVAVDDADRINTTSTNDCIVAFTALTAPREYQVSTADIIGDIGRVFIVMDESGDAGSYTITITTEGSETIDGSASYGITTSYGVVKMYTNGSNLFMIS